ncbi:MAG: dockerin type I repeat-containing protein [Ruminococcus sp.]|nr:dockerin type I repeat-containing protein [Ruminococcus sp.]
MKKRLFSAVLSSAIVMSTLGAMTGSAIFVGDTEGSESYNKRIESYNEKYTSSPEITELVADVFPNWDVVNAWFNKIDDFNCTNFSIEFSHPDYISFRSMTLPQNDEEVEALVNEIKAELGYEDLIKLSAGKDGLNKYYGIGIGFVEGNYQLNYMIAEKAYAIIKDKCEIHEIQSGFSRRQFIDLTVFNRLYIPCVIDGVEHTEIRDERLKEIYESVDHDMLKEKYGTTLDEKGTLKFAEDTTVIDRLKCFKYFVENYDAHIVGEAPASNDSMTVGEADFSEISYLDGDANRDKTTTIADAAAVFQSLANPDKYQLSEQGKFNADSKGDGITVDDAVRIQKKLAGITE